MKNTWICLATGVRSPEDMPQWAKALVEKGGNTKKARTKTVRALLFVA